MRISEGSSKNTIIYKEATQTEFGKGAFEFLDYFSVFDWGRFLNSPIKYKGIAMAAAAKKYFELLKQEGIKTHYAGMDGMDKMNIRVVNIPEPYKPLNPNSNLCLLPIEIIFRNYTHPESSDLKKIMEGRKTFKELGYEKMPKPNEKLPETKISYSTKLEAKDRVLDREEARILAGLTNKEMNELEELAFKVNNIITKHSKGFGMVHYDGKIEVAKDSESEFMVVDVVGTLDEDRFMVKVDDEFADFSKQVLRNWYSMNGWKNVANNAKKKAEDLNIEDWKQFCSPPPKLPENISRIASEMYLSYAEACTGENIGNKLNTKVRSLKKVAEDIFNFYKKRKINV